MFLRSFRCSGFWPGYPGDRQHPPCGVETVRSTRRQSPTRSSATFRPLGQPQVGPLTGTLLVLAVLLVDAAPARAEALVNPGFESGFTGWLEADPAAISTRDSHLGR